MARTPGTESPPAGAALGRFLISVCVVLALPTALWPATPVASGTYLFGEVLITGCIWWGAAVYAGPARRGWVLLAVTASSWLVGDALQRFLEARGASTVGAGPADVVWLASYPLMVAAVAELIRGRGLSRSVRREIRLDLTVTTTASAVVVWQLAIAPALQDGGGLTLTEATSVLYPLGDIAVATLALTLILAPGRRGAAGWLLLAVLGLTFAVDTLFSAQPILMPNLEAERLDALLLVVNSLLGAAAVHPDRALLAEPPPIPARPAVMHRWRVVLLGVGLAAVTGSAALPVNATGVSRVGTAVAGLAISAAILARFLGVVRERELAETRLFEQAHHDQLTGLANRSLLRDRISAEIADPSRRIALLYIDLDGFKGVNDRHGHLAGDAVLTATAARLRALTRASDTAARIGGDEFVLLCPDLAVEHAERLGYDLRAAVGAPIGLDDGTRVSVGVSVGVYVATRAAATAGSSVVADVVTDHPTQAVVDEMLHTADTAMYRAKQSGDGVRVVTALPVAGPLVRAADGALHLPSDLVRPSEVARTGRPRHRRD